MLIFINLVLNSPQVPFLNPPLLTSQPFLIFIYSPPAPSLLCKEGEQYIDIKDIPPLYNVERGIKGVST